VIYHRPFASSGYDHLHEVYRVASELRQILSTLPASAGKDIETVNLGITIDACLVEMETRQEMIRAVRRARVGCP
jgi:hypothetical protein